MFDGLRVLRSPCQLRSTLQSWRAVGEKVALIPVFGPVHEGHLDLLRAGQQARARVVACLLTPSGSALPRDLHADRVLLDAAQIDAAIAPKTERFRPDGHRTRLRMGGLTDVLCGAVEQGCFDFAVLMTLRLINQTRADLVLLSEAQWQLCVILSQLVGDLDLGTQISIEPALRQDDGVACSAELKALPAPRRAAAVRFAQILADTARTIRHGGDPARCCRDAAERLDEAGIDGIDYLEIRHAGTLSRVHDLVLGGPARLFGAVRIDGIRLIDNRPVV
ncbi:MAG: pantoate--beta-alanine ligase [Pseudomonadota bacterium]